MQKMPIMMIGEDWLEVWVKEIRDIDNVPEWDVDKMYEAMKGKNNER